MMETQNPDKLDLLNILIRFKNAFLQLWPLMLVFTVLVGAFSVYRAKASYVPMYQSKAIFTVEAATQEDDLFGTGAYMDQYAAQQMAENFPLLLNTAVMQDLVVEQIGKGYINGTASAQSVSDSNMLVLTVQSTNPEDAHDYLRAIIECYPRVAVYMFDNPKIRIVEEPTMPSAPFNSFSPVSSAIKGSILGVVASMVIMLLLALASRTIQTADELKSTVNLPILVALPKVTVKKRRKNKSKTITAESNSNMAESLRGLRMKIKKHLEEGGKKTILVTSTLAGEGKTTVAVNLAQSLIMDGHKVVVLDADFRRQSVAGYLGETATGNGLMDCLRDSKLSIGKCIRSTKDGLCYVSGNSTDKRQYTIEYRAMRNVLDELAKEFDYIIIDTPPSEVVSDATALCRYADCVVYVIRQDYAKRSQVLNAITALHQKDVTITGCVFNGVPQYQRQYGYGYRSTYGYGYDYGYRKYSYGNKYGYGSRYGKYGYSKYAREAGKKNQE